MARFVSLDSDQRASRQILADARERLESAQARLDAAWRRVLDWDADDFFSAQAVLDAIGGGVPSPADLMRLEDWPHGEDALRPLTAEVAAEYQRAREALPSLVARWWSDSEVAGLWRDWDDFRRSAAGLPEIRWPPGVGARLRRDRDEDR